MEPSLRSPEMRELINKVAAWPHGLGFLHLADVETIASTLQVHPFTVVAAREALEVPESRAYLIDEVRRAREEGTAIPTPMLCPPAEVPPPACVDMTPESLIEAACEHPLGCAFLKHGHPEAVAVTFQVHPNLVFRARELLSKREPEVAAGDSEG